MKLTNEELLEFKRMNHEANRKMADPRRDLRKDLDKLYEKEPFLIGFNDKALRYAELEFFL